MTLKSSQFDLLKTVVRKRAPEMMNAISIPLNDWSGDLRNRLCDVIGEELTSDGLQPDFEPNAYGLELEGLIDRLSEKTRDGSNS